MPGSDNIHILLFLFILLVSGCQHLNNNSNSIFIDRYKQYLIGELPEQYLNISNPLSASEAHISEGKKLYQQQCINCHGSSGEGNGRISQFILPHPADLTLTRQLPFNKDIFLYWTIAEGGQQFNTAMPSFKTQLTDRQIWKISHYIQSGFSIE